VKSQSPLLGFNNNVKHKGRVFHIQTEDSGIRHPHIITHLFADGGRILKTTKTSYAEHVGQDGMADVVTAMMKEQHKAMFIALRDGQFDHYFDEARPAPSKPIAKEPTPPPAPAVAAFTAPAQTTAQPAPAVASLAEPPSRRPSRPRLEIDPGVLHGAMTLPATNAVPQPPASAPTAGSPSLDLDLDALERAASETQTPFFQTIQDLPPPPAAVLGRKPQTAGSYRVSPVPGAPTPTQGTAVPRVDPPPPAPPERPAPARSTPTNAGRYAASRPAAIFANTRPPEGASIFGEELISEKSLDEVILSYLAEDLEPPPAKK
jgi:hypothetical protein